MCSLLPGSASGKSIPLKAMPLPPPQSSAYSMPPPSANGNITPANTNHMLDYLESQVRGMDMTSPLLQVCPTSASRVFGFYLGFPRSLFFYYRVLLIASICLHQVAPHPPNHMQQVPPPHQHMPAAIPFSPGPPSMISALDDAPTERRIITLPPIREQRPHRNPPSAPKTRPPSSSESSRSGFGRRDERGAAGRRYPSPARSRGIPRSYSEDSLDGRSHGRARAGMDRPRSRSRDDLFDGRSRANYSPPAGRRSRGGSWSSDDEDSSRRGGARGGRGGYGDKPPNYTEYEPGQKPGARYSVRNTLL